MEVIVEFIGLIGEVFFMFGDGPDEQRIEENIVAMMAFSWFAELRKNPEYEELIRKNDSVRYVIGKMRMKRMKNSPMYEERKERRLMKELHKQLVAKTQA